MGLEESPHCPFDVVEACRTGDLDTGSGDRGTRFRLPPGRPTEADSDTKRVRFGVLLQTTTTGGCLAISGATLILSFLSAPGRFSCLY